MKKMKFLFIVVLLFSFLNMTQAQDVFCRYQKDGGVHYGKVVGKTIRQLNQAPWLGVQETGSVVPLQEVKLLHPSEPQVILGLSGSLRQAWKGKKPFKTVRWFLKPPSAVASPGEAVILPAALDEVEVEVELIIVIGKKVKNADPNEAQQAIFGYTIGDDIVGSVDSYHRLAGELLTQQEKLLAPGLKIGDGFAPTGPFIYRGIDWQNRRKKIVVHSREPERNTEYTETTADLVYSPAKIVSDLSRVLTLSPGDIIFTGTGKSFPAKAGDTVTVSIEGLGSLTNSIVKP